MAEKPNVGDLHTSTWGQWALVTPIKTLGWELGLNKSTSLVWLSYAVWSDDILKRIPFQAEICSKSSCSSFYLRIDVFKVAPKVTEYLMANMPYNFS